MLIVAQTDFNFGSGWLTPAVHRTLPAWSDGHRVAVPALDMADRGS